MVSRLVPLGLLYIAVKAHRPGGPEEEIVTESDYGYDYQRFFSYYTLDEIRGHLGRLGLSVVHAEVSPVTLKGDWIQIIGQMPPGKPT